MIKLLRFTFFFLINVIAFAQAAAIVEKGTAQKTATETIIRFNVNEAVMFTSFRLDNPPRLVVDIPKAQLRHKTTSLPISSNTVQGVRLGTQQGTDLRIVIDLSAAIPASTALLKTKKSYELVIRVGQALSNAQPEAGNTSSGYTPLTLPSSEQIVTEQSIQVAKTIKKKQITIVIDPGHGGKDPGAIGPTGTQEKRIVLAVAKELQTMINKTPGMRALLTRTGDRFIPLRERVLFARRNQADMFISIHADAGSRTANGSSVYILSTGGASSEMANLLAKRENESDLAGGVKISNKDAAIASMLLDLSIDATIESSNALATYLLRNLQRNGGLHKKGVERAAFAVLKAPDIPSVLIETGFISNPNEERKLMDRGYQRKIAGAIMQGIKSYFKERPATELVITTSKNQVKPIQQDYQTNLLPLNLSGGKQAQKNDHKINIKSPKASASKRYLVKSGDTLLSISRQLKINEKDFKKHNNLPPNQLRVPVGTSLSVP